MADGSNFKIHYVQESTPGTTPAAPVWKAAPFSSFSLAGSRGTVEGANIKAGRFASKPIRGAVTAGGDWNADLEYSVFDDFIEGALGGTWQADTPSAGQQTLIAGSVRRAFSIAGFYEDLATGNKYRILKGMEVNVFNLSVATESTVKATFTFVGWSEETAAAKGGTEDTPVEGEVFDTFTGSINEGGASIATVTEITVNLNNNMESKPTILTGTGASQPSIGISKLTGNMTVYFESMALYEKVLNGTETSITFTITNADGSYTFTMPKVTLTGGQPDVSSAGAVTLPLAYEANYDSVTGTHLRVVKA